MIRVLLIIVFISLFPSIAGSFTLGPDTCCVGLRGNIDNDPTVNDILDISDLLFLVDYFFGDPPGPAPVCPSEADVDGNGRIDVSDILYYAEYFFGHSGLTMLDCGY